jgi:hypothetical protein
MGEVIRIRAINPRTRVIHEAELDEERIADLRPGNPLPASAGAKALDERSLTGYLWTGAIGRRRRHG